MVLTSKDSLLRLLSKFLAVPAQTTAPKFYTTANPLVLSDCLL